MKRTGIRRIARRARKHALSLFLIVTLTSTPTTMFTASTSSAESEDVVGEPMGGGILDILPNENVSWPSIWMKVTPGEGVHGNIGKQATVHDLNYDVWNRLFAVDVPVDDNFISICGPQDTVWVELLQIVPERENQTMYAGELQGIPVCEWN